MDYLRKCNLRSEHTIEQKTALLCEHNDILLSLGRKEHVVVVMLDISSAFDTIDHDVLLDRMESTLG